MNQLNGVIHALSSGEGIHQIEVTVAQMICAATVTGDGASQHWSPGQRVVMTFRELDVSLAKNLSGQISIRNILPCTVSALEHGEVLTRVALNLGTERLFSVITRNSANRLKLEVGDSVDALIKANAMMLLPEAQS